MNTPEATLAAMPLSSLQDPVQVAAASAMRNAFAPGPDQEREAAPVPAPVPALRLQNVSRRLDDVQVVDDLSFSVDPGTVLGFLGANGAGKTTTLRMILGVMQPDSGAISIFGCPRGEIARHRIGFLAEERGLYPALSALDAVIYFGRLKGMQAAEARRRGRAMLERFGLARNLATPVRRLSKGMAQKVQLATALINEPDLLILDEPFSGLDPLNQRLLETEILAAARRGAAVLFSTHVMQHAERLCDRLLLLSQGRKCFEGTLESARSLAPARVRVITKASPARFGIVASATDTPLDLSWRQWDVELHPGHQGAELLECLSAAAIPVRMFEDRHTSLHDLFLEIVGNAGGAKGAA